ncbi:MAG: methylmalonyl-CoA mutase family protein [Patulibacter minatonensis]
MTDTSTDVPAEPTESDPNAPLTLGFAKIPERFWEGKVREAVGDDVPLASTDDDGLAVKWLYTPDDAIADDPAGLPGRAPFVRGTRVGAAWDLRQEHGHPVLRTANAQILEDLSGGVTSVTLVLDRSARSGTAPSDDTFAEQRGQGGTAISTVDDLDAALEDVYLDLAAVSLDAGPAAIAAAALLRALWERRELDLSAVRGSYGYDPIGTLARDGELLESPEDAVARAGRFAADTAAATPAVQALRVDTRAFVEAGATPAREIAIAASIGTAYLRAAAAAGLGPEQAATQIEFQLTAGPVQFGEIAKFRALRRVWARILEASGVPEEGRKSPLYARATDRMLSAVDPWTNMLRGTTGLFASAVGGADGATVASFDRLLGTPTTLGRRIARNTQVILLEESGLARVADPAGGSWYVEARTDDLAQAAWAQLQELEAAGGVLAALTSGALATQLAESAEARHDALVRRKRELTGVNTFPLLGDDAVTLDEPVDLAELARRDAARLAERGTVAGLDAAASDASLADLATLATAGARIDELAAVTAGSRHSATPLPVLRDAAPFEELRALSPEPPKVLLAPVGSLASTVNIVTWARNYFAVGGIEAVVPAAGEDPLALQAEGRYPVVAVAPGRGVEDEEAAKVVAALREAGATHIVLAAGKDDRAQAIGADGAVRDGQDMTQVLRGLHDLLDAR